MKTAIVSSIVALGSGSLVKRESDPTGDRRYSQLTEMMAHYNADFDERKYWTYGCNCLILGDRPMSDPGHGPPIDALDVVCKAYKDCVKCTKAEFGDECIGEFQKYRFGYKNGEVNCKDDAGSCHRSLCECDAKFAKEHVAKKDVFNTDYHMFWSTLANGWEPKDNCPRGGSGPYDPKCCGGNDTPFLLYNEENHDCCLDGSVAKEDQC